MIGNYYFFEKKKFKSASGLKKDVYYEYKGYLARNNEGRLYCPIILHFGRDEIFFLYIDKDGKPYKVFTLPVAEGELNQGRLSQKIEAYWKMPLWKPITKSAGDNNHQFFIETSLSHLSYFLTIYGIGVEKDSSKNDVFVRRLILEDGSPYDNYLQINIKDTGRKLIFAFLNREEGYGFDNDHNEIWELFEDAEDGNERIKTNYINFRKLFLDFLYDLENSTTFDDENFLLLQPVLQNNKLIFALSKKCRFYHVLTFIDGYIQGYKMPDLPKEYRTVEKAWLNVCFSEQYREVFISRDSVFLPPEDEVRNVIFNANVILKDNLLKRNELLTKEDIPLRNQASTFFLRRYLIFDAFDILMSRAWTFTLFLLFAFTPFSDYLLKRWDACKDIAGTYTAVMPVFMLGAWGWYYYRHRINLFKLILPRLFLGILLGWAAFWGGEDSWKAALIASGPKVIILDLFLLILLYLYIFTDIRNKLVLISDWQVAKRAFWLVFFAMIISLVQGHYVIQFKAKTMIENSGFLETLTQGLSETKSISVLKGIKEIREKAKKGLNSKECKKGPVELADYEKHNGDFILGWDGLTIAVDNYSEIDRSLYKVRYIWSVLLSQFLMSILIGIILQLIWEDRPITEPL